MNRRALVDAQRWVIKVGSSLVTNGGTGLDHRIISAWAAQISALRKAGKEIVLVSSGAVAEGLARTGRETRPTDRPELQAVAAIGQMGMVQAYESAFAEHGLGTAQILLTHDDVENRDRYLNAQGALLTLLDWGVIPIVNENDTVSTDEIRLGDNDTLAALVTNLVEADVLAILTDQQGLYTADPRANPDAELVSEALLDDPRLEGMAGAGRGSLGRGGMRTKLIAAHWAARSGASTLIAPGATPDILGKLAAGEELGTWLHPVGEAMQARKRWIAGQHQLRGRVLIDAGAARALRDGGHSLLPVGVVKVEGDFDRGDLIACIDPNGVEVGRGLSNYTAIDARKLCGVTSVHIQEVLGKPGDTELVHRENLVVHNT